MRASEVIKKREDVRFISIQVEEEAPWKPLPQGWDSYPDNVNVKKWTFWLRYLRIDEIDDPIKAVVSWDCFTDDEGNICECSNENIKALMPVWIWERLLITIRSMTLQCW